MTFGNSRKVHNHLGTVHAIACCNAAELRRRRDAGGALRINPADAEDLGISADSRVRVTTEAGSAETGVQITDVMQPGHVSFPNGLGVAGREVVDGMTSSARMPG